MPAVSLLYDSARRWLLEHGRKRVAIIHAQMRAQLDALLEAATAYYLQQHFRGLAIELARAGYESAPYLKGKFDLILINPAKSRQQTLGWIAEAMDHLHPSGHLMICAENKHGAKGIEARLRGIADAFLTVSKSKCRLICIPVRAIHAPEVIKAWRQQAGMQWVQGIGLYSMPGLFCWNRPDTGSQLLLEHLPSRLDGVGMDLCAGNGFLAAGIMRHCHGIAHLYLVDHDRFALDCANANLAGSKAPYSLCWLDAVCEPLPGHLDWVVCNPPFHAQQAQSIALGQRILARACQALRRGGRLWVVANRKLPYENVLREHLRGDDIIRQEQGYKIIRGVR